MSAVKDEDIKDSVDSGIGMSVTHKRVRIGSIDPEFGRSTKQKTARRCSVDAGTTAPTSNLGRGASILERRVSVDHGQGYNRERRASVDHGQGYNRERRASVDHGQGYSRERRASVDHGQGYNRERRASVDHGQGYSRERRASMDHGQAYSKDRRSSVDIQRQKLYEEMAKLKHVPTVRERRQSIQLQCDVTNRLSQGFSRVNLGNQKVTKASRKIDECLTKDPNLREDQVKVILQSFSTLDENGDGRISKREIARAYRLAGFNPTKTEVQDIVLEHDDNDDGYIDFEEYFNVMRTKMITMDFEKERLKTAFRVLDLDQDGYISREELKHALSKTGDTFTEDEIKDIIDRADKNLDGKIDYNEYVEADLCKSVF